MRHLKPVAFATHILSEDPDEPIQEVVLLGADLSDGAEHDQLAQFELGRLSSALQAAVRELQAHDLILVEEGEEVGGEYVVRLQENVSVLVARLQGEMIHQVTGSDPNWGHPETGGCLIAADTYQERGWAVGREQAAGAGRGEHVGGDRVPLPAGRVDQLRGRHDGR